MEAEDRLQSNCETCGRIGLVLPSSRGLESLPRNVELGYEVRWLLVREGRLWVALPRNLTADEACETLREETGVLWLRRCSTCVFSESRGDAGFQEPGNSLFGVLPDGPLEGLGKASDSLAIQGHLDEIILERVRRFEIQAFQRARHARVHDTFISMLNSKEVLDAFELLSVAAMWEVEAESRGIRHRPSRVGRRRGRPESRPILNELIRLVARVYRKVDEAGERKNLWMRVTDAVRPYLFLDPEWTRRRMTGEAVRQIVKRDRPA